MTAIERLRIWFKEEKRPETAAWITGDTVDTRAILELAERLDKLEASRESVSALLQYKVDKKYPPVTPLPRLDMTESALEPFKITGPGDIVPAMAVQHTSSTTTAAEMIPGPGAGGWKAPWITGIRTARSGAPPAKKQRTSSPAHLPMSPEMNRRRWRG